MFKRFRHRRESEDIRKKHRENFLSAKDFILPLFLVEGEGVKHEIPSMKGVYHFSCDILLKELEVLTAAGLQAVLLFGVPSEKGICQAYSSGGIVQKSIPSIKKAYPSLEVITDVCLCSFTEDGHCCAGNNDETCEILAKIAVSHAEAGADVVAPSDMMDGRVRFIKKALTEAGFNRVKIMSYSAKYASFYYGPFRDAAHCAPKQGDRKSYQMDPPNSDEAMEEIAADIEEGADSYIVKPALSYLDIIRRAKERFDRPVAAYNVSGEYQMLRSAVETGAAKKEIIYESLISMKRAGADRIISYFTPDILLNNKQWIGGF